MASSQSGVRGGAATTPPAHAPAAASTRKPGRLMCDHLHDTTTRYDPVGKLLTFLMVCPVCRIERVIETLDYVPSYKR